MRIHVLIPYGEQAHVFTVEGHEWLREPQRAGSDRVSSMQLGPLAVDTLALTAGGEAALPGDYLYGDHREPYREAGYGEFFGFMQLERLEIGSKRCARASVRPDRAAHSPPIGYVRLLADDGCLLR